ncbi:MAG: ATP-binding protein [Chloroflexia bacterium]|nr:ATP-binding protein [Chloroflexia bacterium]
MNVIITGLGLIQNAEINIDKKFTVFTGKNNTGKSYLNYLLYGLYRIDEDKLARQLHSLITNEIKVETNDKERIIKLSIDIYGFILANLERIVDLYASLLLENISNLFATNKLKPGIKLIVTEEDKKLFLKLKGNFNYIDEDFDGLSGYSLKDGILIYKTTTNKNEDWEKDFIEEHRKTMKPKIVSEILRYLKNIFTFPNDHPANSNVFFLSRKICDQPVL